MSRSMIYILVGVFCYWIAYTILKYIVIPWIYEKGTKEIAKNPDWLVSELKTQYYGTQDIDFVVVESRFGLLPRFRLAKKNQLQLLISSDMTTRDIELIARAALVGKIKIKYNLWFPEKPAYWLSILCYMLDGGNINQSGVKWKRKSEE